MSLFGKMSYRCDETTVEDYDETGIFFEMMQCASNIIEKMVEDNTELVNDFQYVKLLIDRINCGKDFNMDDAESGNYL